MIYYEVLFVYFYSMFYSLNSALENLREINDSQNYRLIYLYKEKEKVYKNQIETLIN